LLFWAASAAGLLAVLVFVATTGTLRGPVDPADAYLLVGVVLCGLGYAEGGALARELGGARTICWALVLSLPATLTVSVLALRLDPPQASASAWWGFAYVTVFSMLLGFFAWYAGLARGGVARVGQLQLAQPVLTLLWSALLLAEPVSAGAVGAAVIVLGCVALTQRSRRPAPAIGYAASTNVDRSIGSVDG
jgi:drug/metabolite transporter (DMT)-like permease